MIFIAKKGHLGRKVYTLLPVVYIIHILPCDTVRSLKSPLLINNVWSIIKLEKVYKGKLKDHAIKWFIYQVIIFYHNLTLTPNKEQAMPTNY